MKKALDDFKNKINEYMFIQRQIDNGYNVEYNKTLSKSFLESMVSLGQNIFHYYNKILQENNDLQYEINILQINNEDLKDENALSEKHLDEFFNLICYIVQNSKMFFNKRIHNYFFSRTDELKYCKELTDNILDEINNLQSINDDLQDEINNFRSTNDDLQYEIDDLQRTNRNLQEDINDLQSTNDDLQSEIHNMRY